MCNCFIWFSAGVLMRLIQCQWLVPGRQKQTWLHIGWRWRGPDYKSLFEHVHTRIFEVQLQKNQTAAFWDCSMLNKFIFKNIEINKVKCKNETPVCKLIHCNFILNLYFFNAYVSKSGSFQTSSVLESAHICIHLHTAPPPFLWTANTFTSRWRSKSSELVTVRLVRQKLHL